MAKFRADPSTAQGRPRGRRVSRSGGQYAGTGLCAPRGTRRCWPRRPPSPTWRPPGREEFNSAVEELVLGAGHPARRDRRARTRANAGRCGALRVGAELIRAARPAADRSRQRSDLGQPRAAARQFGLEARALSLLRCRRAPAALRGHAGAPGARARGRRRADSCLLPQPDRRRSDAQRSGTR